MKKILTIVTAFFFLGVTVSAQQEVLTNESIVKMVQVGLGTDLIIEKINEAAEVQFDLSIEGLVALKEARVSDDVIRAMKSKQEAQSPAPVGTAIAAPSATPAAPATDAVPAQFDEAHYLMKAPAQEKPVALEGNLMFDPAMKVIRFVGNGVTQLEVPYQSITGLLYEKTATPRYGWGLVVSWPLLFTKSKAHYFTIQYRGPNGTGEFAIIRLHKKNYQMAVATAESQTGIKVEREQEH